MRLRLPPVLRFTLAILLALLGGAANAAGVCALVPPSSMASIIGTPPPTETDTSGDGYVGCTVEAVAEGAPVGIEIRFYQSPETAPQILATQPTPGVAAVTPPDVLVRLGPNAILSAERSLLAFPAQGGSYYINGSRLPCPGGPQPSTPTPACLSSRASMIIATGRLLVGG